MIDNIIIYLGFWAIILCLAALGGVCIYYKRNAFIVACAGMLLSGALWTLGFQEFYFAGYSGLGYTVMINTLMYMSLIHFLLSITHNIRTYTRIPLRVFLITITSAHGVISIVQLFTTSSLITFTIPIILITLNSIGSLIFIAYQYWHTISYASPTEKNVYFTPRIALMILLIASIIPMFFIERVSLPFLFIWFTMILISVILMSWSLLRLHIVEINDIKYRMIVYGSLAIMSAVIIGIMLYYTSLEIIVPKYTFENIYIHMPIFAIFSVLLFGIFDTYLRDLFYPFMSSGSFSTTQILRNCIHVFEEEKSAGYIEQMILNHIRDVASASYVSIISSEKSLTVGCEVFPLLHNQKTQSKKLLVIGEKENYLPFSEKERRSFVLTSHYLGFIEYANSLVEKMRRLEDTIGRLRMKNKHHKRDVNMSQERAMNEIAHNLQTPITIARTEIALLKQKLGDTPWLRSFEKSIENLSSFVYRLLRSSQVDTPLSRKSITSIHIPTLISDIVATFQHIAQPYNAQIKSSPIPDVHIQGNAQDIEECIVNILNNALKYGRKDILNIIAITANADQEGVHIRISDTGVGIAPEDQEKIFRKLYRSENASHHAAGTGLGLSICWRIAKRHNGSLEVESTPGRGSMFILSLPYTQEQKPSTNT